MKKLLKRIKKLGKCKKLKDPFCKLIEEVGEVGECINVEDYGMSKTLTENSAEECADVMVVALELYFDRGGTLAALQRQMTAKVDRWERRLTRRGYLGD